MGCRLQNYGESFPSGLCVVGFFNGMRPYVEASTALIWVIFKLFGYELHLVACRRLSITAWFAQRCSGLLCKEGKTNTKSLF